MIPKKIREIIMLFELNNMARLSAKANPPAIIIIRIMPRLKDADHNDNLLLSFWYLWVFRYSSLSQTPFSFSGKDSDHIKELR